MNVLLTGGTGNIGRPLAKKLEKIANVFYLIRNVDEKERKKLLNGIPRNKILEGNITKENCGVKDFHLSKLANLESLKVVHNAASVRFDIEKEKKTRLTNVIGTKNVIGLANKLQANSFVYISTAYTGDRNPYESSKLEAEKIIKKLNFPFLILKPSVVIGDSRTGVTGAFDGMYGFFGGMHSLACLRRKTLGLKNLEQVDLPFCIDCSFSSTINLIPIDWVIDTMIKLIIKRPVNRSFYITHHNPPRVQWVMEEVFKILGINNICYNYYKNSQAIHQDKTLRRYQKKINNGINRYLPYVTEEKIFSWQPTKLFLEKEFSFPPLITPELLKLLFGYAIKKKFRK